MALSSVRPAAINLGYGSNMWLDQMRCRCPTSTLLGIGRLDGYRWIINSLGSATLVKTGDNADVSWGCVYQLTDKDEAVLDECEHIAEKMYEKQLLEFDMWRVDTPGRPNHINVNDPKRPAERISGLVYIDVLRTEPGPIRHEYVIRMNRAIHDLVALGAPQSYVDAVLRKFVPKLSKEALEEAMRSKEVLQAKDGNYDLEGRPPLASPEVKA